MEGVALTYIGMRYFLDIFNEQFQTNQMYCEMNYFLIMSKFKPYTSKEKDDIQILFGSVTSFKWSSSLDMHLLQIIYSKALRI